MIYTGIIEGHYVNLKSCEEKDAEFTLSIRQAPDLTKYLPRLEVTLSQQKEWIREQRNAEGDYFFVARTRDGKSIGTVSIYNIKDEISESGRLALIGDALENTEATLLLFHFAFNILGIKEVKGYILDGNKRAERFNKQFGCVYSRPECLTPETRIKRTLITTESFHESVKKLCRLLYKGPELEVRLKQFTNKNK